MVKPTADDGNAVVNAVDSTASAAAGDEQSTTSASVDGGLTATLLALWLGFRQRLFLQLQLLTLETQRAAQSLVNLLILACLAAGLVISCWIGLLAVGILLLTGAGLSMLTAISCMLLLNVFVLMLCLKLIRVQSCYLCFPATVAMLKPSPPEPIANEQNTDG